MKNTKLSLLALALTGLVALTGCVEEDPEGESECTSNIDCTEEGEVCNLDTNMCVPEDEELECTSNDECTEEGEVCNLDTNVCEPEEEVLECTTNEDCTEEGFVCDTDVNRCYDPEVEAECSEDSECPIGQFCDFRFCADIDAECATTEDCEAGEVCTSINTCAAVAEDEAEFYTVMIDDFTGELAAERCEDETYGYQTAGPKLMYTLLYNADGEFLAAGTAVDQFLGLATEFTNVEGIFNGDAPDYALECPDIAPFTAADDSERMTSFRDDVIVAMGCESALWLQFYDADGTIIPLLEGYTIKVGEYGPVCSAEDENDPQRGDEFYGVTLCSDDSTEGIDEVTCTQIIDDEGATGVTDFTITLTAAE